MKMAGWVAALLILAGAGIVTAGDDPKARDDDRIARAVSHCLEGGDLIACYEALNRRPNDPALLVGEADTLVQQRRPGEAIGVYRNAISVGASHHGLLAKLARADSLRRSLLHSCMSKKGLTAAHACESAWLPGAPDEVAVFKRRGALLQDTRNYPAALDAYLSAARLAPKDAAAARAIVALANQTGRRDAATLAAVIKAKSTLHVGERVPLRPTRAIAAAVRTAPSPGAPAKAAAPIEPVEPIEPTYVNEAEATRSN